MATFTHSHGPAAHKPRKPKKIDAATMHSISQTLARVIAYRNIGKDADADRTGEHLLRLLHSTGVLGANQWRVP